MKKIVLRGSSFDIGRQLGEFGRNAWHQKVTRTALWQTVTARKHSAQVREMRASVTARFPAIWQELEGLAAGLEADIDAVFAWNCRGDLVRSTSDGCTTVAGVTDAGERLIAHNEDGFPQLRPDCALVEVEPDESMAFLSFAYPGSICGHTFAVNAKGVVNTVNNIRAVDRPAGMPRQVLARATLNAATLDEAIAILTSTPRAGAFHHTLGQMGDDRLFSVEATGTGCSVQPLTGRFGHANHLTHVSLAQIEQVITDSSASRQQRLQAWSALPGHPDADQALAVLSDQQNEALPIYRLSDADPDEENTLATMIFTLSAHKIDWALYGLDRRQPELQGSLSQSNFHC